MAATRTGIDAQVGYVAEATYGTGVTVTRFLPLISETMTKTVSRVESTGIMATRQVMTSQQWAPGLVDVAGDIQHELDNQSIGLLLKQAFGTFTTAGTAVPYTHTFTPAPPQYSFTAQVGRPLASSGSVIAHTYTGCKIASWEMGFKPGQIVTWGMTLVAQQESAGTALAAASYTSGLAPWVATSASFTIDGTVLPVVDGKIHGDNGLDDKRHYIGGGTIGEPLRAKPAAYTGELNVEWGASNSLGTLLYDRYINGTESTLVMTLASGTLAGTVTANVRFDGDTPNVTGPGILMQKIPWKAVANGTLDSSAITAILVNNDSTP